DEAEVPEEERDDEVRRDRDDVPRERTPELRPDGHRARVWSEPIEEPRSTEVQQRKEPGLQYGEERHRFGKTIDRSSPPLLEQQEKGRDEGPSVTDPHPPHEVGDAERPCNGNVVPPNTDPRDERVRNRSEKHRRARERQEKRPSHQPR